MLYVLRAGHTSCDDLSDKLFVVFQCNALWAPSQKGNFADLPQPHMATFLACSISTWNGAMPLPAWLPSQWGQLAVFPQAQ
jgi:hypothetical protein